MTSRMYRENRRSINAFVGCRHDCVYCKPSFQRQAKRQRKRCLKCYSYEPHFHPERLLKPPPKTVKNEFIFFPSMGDPAFAQPHQFKQMLDYATKYSDRTFLVQSKDPGFFLDYDFAENIILGTTIETNKTTFSETPSTYRFYRQISAAPTPEKRYYDFLRVEHPRKLVTIEPVLEFDCSILESWMRKVKPEIIYVGYDNHNCNLPEPALTKTKLLIKHLKKISEVRIKTLRKAWSEK